MITLKNPTSTELSITYKGNTYKIEPEGTIVVLKEVADFWLGTHEFLLVSVTIAKETPKVEVVKEVEPVEVKEEIPALVETKPAKKITKK